MSIIQQTPQYMNTLEMFQDYCAYFPTVNVIPLTVMKDKDGDGVKEQCPTPFIKVDLDSREIILPDEYATFLSIEKDHRAENLFFLVDRYYEDVDLFQTSCVVEYINAAGQARVYPITLYDKDSLKREGKMIMTWCISGDATAAAGPLQFALRFYKIDTEKKIFIYNLHTKSATGIIEHGMQIDDEMENEKEEHYSSIDYETLIAMINQKNVYWNDL